MEKYIVIKELPDAPVGTEVNWDEDNNVFWYNKNVWIPPYKKNHLSAGQVTQNPEYFCEADKYPEYFAYKNPVFSKEEIINLLNESFPDQTIDGGYKISPARELLHFKGKLNELGKVNAEKLIKKNER